MSYLDDHLLAGERIVYRARLHWTIFLAAIVVVLLGVGLGILLQAVEPAYSYAGLGLAGIGMLLAIGPAIRYVTSEFAVTDKRVLGKVGFIERESDETLLSKVEAIAVDQGILGRFLGFGTHDHRHRRYPGSVFGDRGPAGVSEADPKSDYRTGGAEGRATRRSGAAGPYRAARRARMPALRRAHFGPRSRLQALWTGRCAGVNGPAGDALAGSILGQALGDALGFVVEARPPEVARVYVDGWLRTGRAGEWPHPRFPFGQYSDDTQLARELLRSFRDSGGWDPSVFAERLAELFHERRDVGAGRGTRSAALRLLMGVSWRESGTPAPYAGNGAAMRAGPLGLLLSEREAMGRAAREQARITHLDPRCAAGAVAVARAVAIAGARQSIDNAAFLEDLARCAETDDRSVASAVRGLNEWLRLAPEKAACHVHESGLDPAHMDRWQGISAFVTPSVLWGLYSFLRTPDDYWETICTAIEVGGDTDTMAAIAGAISSARLGMGALPGHLVDLLNDNGEWGAAALIELAHSCAGIVEAH